MEANETPSYSYENNLFEIVIWLKKEYLIDLECAALDMLCKSQKKMGKYLSDDEFQVIFSHFMPWVLVCIVGISLFVKINFWAQRL